MGQAFISGVCIIYFPFPRISNSQIATIICSARRKQKWEEMQERKRMEAEALRSKQFLTSITNPFHMSIIINGTNTNVFFCFFCRCFF